MFSKLERIPSQALGRPVHLWRFGHYGQPLLVFPSSAGIAHEWEYNGLIDYLRDLIEGGRLKLYCTESNVSESWTHWHGDAAERIRRHQAYERYITDELAPQIRRDCRSQRIPIAVAGTSLGAYYAANCALKFPDEFRYALCLSGRYDVRQLVDGYSEDELYYSNPIAYVSGMSGEHLERVRRTVHLDLVCGQGAYEGDNVRATRQFARVLRGKVIPHTEDLWGRDVTHEWTWWNRQARFYLYHRFGNPRSSAPPLANH